MSYGMDTYLITKNNAAGPIYVEARDTTVELPRFYDADGNETKGSRIGRLLSFIIICGFLIYLWAR